MEDRVIIFDTTLRDGEQCPGAAMNKSEKLQVAEQLARLNVDVLEAGFPISSPGDFESVRDIAKQVKGPVIAALARIVEKDVDRAAEALKPAAKRRIHTFTSASDIHLESILRLNRQQNLDKAVKAVKMAKAHTADVEFSAQDTGRADFEYLVDLYTAVAEAGATTLNVPDTVGYSVPGEFGDMLARLIAKVKVKGVVFSVHCHNDLGLAVANSLAAVQAGVRQIECTINGIGERAGNCSLEEVVMALKVRRNLFKLATGINTKEITKTSRLVSTITGITVQPNKAIVGANAFAHESGIHQDGVFKNRQTYEIMEPSDIGLNENVIKLGPRSGRAGPEKRLAQLGTPVDGPELDKAYEAFLALADRKKDIYDDDLLTLVHPEKTSKKDFKLVELAITAGSGHGARQIVLEKEGKALKTVVEGTGPVDAIYKGLQELSGTSYTLVNYSIQAITGGTDAQGDVTVVLEEKGRRASALRGPYRRAGGLGRGVPFGHQPHGGVQGRETGSEGHLVVLWGIESAWAPLSKAGPFLKGKTMANKLKVAVVGATGIAGQQFLACLAEHPWFEITALAGSQRSAGRPYAEGIKTPKGATGWWADGDCPEKFKGMLVQDSAQFDPGSVDLIFTAVESDVAKALEPKYAQVTPVVSAASLFRMEPDSPLIIPGVNSDHAPLVKEMSKKRGWKGFVTAIPNCTTTGLAVTLAPLAKSFGLKSLFMTSMQAVSGAGRSGGVIVLDALDNIIPYIVGEEEKVQREVAKIFGRFTGDGVKNADIAVSCTCTRANVLEGHTESVFADLGKNASVEEVVAAMRAYAPKELEGLPSAPKPAMIHVHDDPFRPQVRLDRDRGAGMVTTVGRVRKDTVLPNGVKYMLVSHNTKMGAARAPCWPRSC